MTVEFKADEELQFSDRDDLEVVRYVPSDGCSCRTEHASTYVKEEIQAEIQLRTFSGFVRFSTQPRIAAK